MKSPQALLTAIAAAALSFAVVVGTAVTLASEPDVATTSASVAREPVTVDAQQIAFVARTDTSGWNADCGLAL